MDITSILLCIIAVVVVIMALVIVPYYKIKLTAEQRSKIKEYVSVAVDAAEQLFPTVDGEKRGKDKLKYVAELLAIKGITFDVDDIYDEVRAIIEAAVKNLKKAPSTNNE